jgi:flagellar export protein FliJ
MPFHFSLDAVLRLRRSQERLERLKLEAIASQHAQARARLGEITQASFELRRKFQQRLASYALGSELQLEMEREAAVNVLRAALRAHIDELEQRRDAQVQVFHNAQRSREVLDDLRLRKLNLYLMERGRREQQELDDQFLMRHASKNPENDNN